MTVENLACLCNRVKAGLFTILGYGGHKGWLAA
jgi:hypothetical protein